MAVREECHRAVFDRHKGLAEKCSGDEPKTLRQTCLLYAGRVAVLNSPRCRIRLDLRSKEFLQGKARPEEERPLVLRRHRGL